MNKIFFLIVLVFLAFFAGSSCIAQNTKQPAAAYKGYFNLHGKVSLDSLTGYVHKSSGIRFSFNASNVKGATLINLPKGNYSLPMLLDCIKKTTSLYFTFYSGYVIFQDHLPVQHFKRVPAKKYPLKIIAASQSHFKPKPNNSKHIKKLIQPADNSTAAITDKVRNRRGTDSNKPGLSEVQRHPINISAISRGKRDTPSILPGSTIKVQDIAKSIPLGKHKSGKNKAPLSLSLGIQWNVVIPVYGLKNYFTGTNGKTQVYNPLIPGLWVSKKIGKKNNELLLMVKIAQPYYAENRSVAVAVSQVSSLDTTLIQQSTIVSKVNTVYAGLQIIYHLNNSWSVSGGINYNLSYAALVNKQTRRVITGELLADSLYGIKRSSAKGQYLASSFITDRAELCYQLSKMQAGIAVLIPITSVFNGANKIYPVNGQFFLRWTIR